MFSEDRGRQPRPVYRCTQRYCGVAALESGCLQPDVWGAIVLWRKHIHGSCATFKPYKRCTTACTPRSLSDACSDTAYRDACPIDDPLTEHVAKVILCDAYGMALLSHIPTIATFGGRVPLPRAGGQEDYRAPSLRPPSRCGIAERLTEVYVSTRFPRKSNWRSSLFFFKSAFPTWVFFYLS